MSLEFLLCYRRRNDLVYNHPLPWFIIIVTVISTTVPGQYSVCGVHLPFTPMNKIVTPCPRPGVHCPSFTEDKMNAFNLFAPLDFRDAVPVHKSYNLSTNDITISDNVTIPSEFLLYSLTSSFLQRRVRRAKVLSPCNCVSNVTQHTFDVERGVYAATVAGACNPRCCSYCKVWFKMYRYVGPIDAETCVGLERDMSIINSLEAIDDYQPVSLGLVYHKQLATGCYHVQLREANGKHLPLSFFWAKPSNKFIDPDTWTPTVLLAPRPDTGELLVQWREDGYPYNYSRYLLQLWYQADKKLFCDGHDASTDAHQIHPPGIQLDQPWKLYTGLSPGWYCVRLTPLDPRCPRDGCAINAAPPVHLRAETSAEPSSEEGEEENDVATLIGWLVGVACVVGLLLAVVAARCYFLRIRRTTATTVMTPITSATASPSCNYSLVAAPPAPVVIVAWTRAGDDDGRVGRAVDALKRVLRASNFTVWDYLDLLSLPVGERERLLENPAGWLCTTVRNPSVKVLLVDSVGAGVWQAALQAGAPRPKDTLWAEGPLDVRLFPLLLQQVLHDPDMLANYSRVFRVRFSAPREEDERQGEGGAGEGGEGLRGVVPAVAYLLPEFLRHLILAMRSSSGADHCGAAESPLCHASLLSALSDACSHFRPTSSAITTTTHATQAANSCPSTQPIVEDPSEDTKIC